MLRGRSVATCGGGGRDRPDVCPGNNDESESDDDGNNNNDNVCAVSSTDQAQGPSPQSGHEQRRVQIQVQEDILEDGKSLLMILEQ